MRFRMGNVSSYLLPSLYISYRNSYITTIIIEAIRQGDKEDAPVSSKVDDEAGIDIVIDLSPSVFMGISSLISKYQN